MHIIKESLKIAIVSAFMLFLIGVAYAWTEPGAAPPNPDSAAPLTVSSTSQYKNGSLGVGISSSPVTILETKAPTIGAFNTVFRGRSNDSAYYFDINMPTNGVAYFDGSFTKLLFNKPVNACKVVSYNFTIDGIVGGTYIPNTYCGTNYYVVSVMDSSNKVINPESLTSEANTSGSMICCKNAD